MSENVSNAVMKQMLDRLPGAAFASRLNTATGQSQWLYLNARAAAFYDVPDASLRADPDLLRELIVPEDRSELENAIQRGIQSGAPMVYCCRMRRRDGSIRWVETHALVEADTEGSIIWYGQALDVTDRKRLEESLLEAQKASARTESLYRQIIDALPLGVMVIGSKAELVHMNPASAELLGGAMDRESRDVTTDALGVFHADGATPMPMEDSGMARCLRGERAEEEVVIRNPRVAGMKRLSVAWTPVYDERGGIRAAVGSALDITLQRALEAELRTRNAELAQSEEAKTQLIERLRHAIDELSNPILEVWDGVLAMPIIGLVDSRRTADMVQRLLGEVARTQASFVIVDLTGVDIVDTKTADHLMKLMRKVEIVGSRCVLTGIRPAVAETLVDIGVDFSGMSTLRNLKHGLRDALRVARREREVDIEDEVVADAQPQRRRAR
ncbi:RsbR, positive regulator of sigma-B [Minicystis rosea]|nr:RsbR, positive regulator of sigma-B [Minicystis rosea]